jgi:hypothetical protein
VHQVLEVGTEAFDVVRIIAADEIVKGTESWGDKGLYVHAVFRQEKQNTEATLENTKYPLNDVSGRGMAQIEEFFLVSWPMMWTLVKIQ